VSRFLLAFFLGLCLAGAPATVPSTLHARYEADVAALSAKFAERLKRSRYMEGDGGHEVRIAGWETFPTKRYTYKITDKDGTVKSAAVVMLNPSADQIARWIVFALVEVKGQYIATEGDKIFQHILSQSGGQFPVAGMVYEDILPHDGKYELYCFRDGVTVRIDGIPQTSTDPLTGEQIETTINGKVARVYTYARIQSTSPAQWIAAGGAADVMENGKPTIQWLEAVRSAYQQAWGSARNELLIAWVKANFK